MLIYELFMVAVLSLVPIAGSAIAGFITAVSYTAVFAEVSPEKH